MRFDPIPRVRVEQQVRAGVAGLVGHLPQDLDGPRVARPIGRLHAAHENAELNVAALEQFEHLGEPPVIGFLPRRDVHRDCDLIELQTFRVERLDPLGDLVEKDVADAGVTEFLEHGRLFVERAFLGIVPVDAEGEKGIGRARRVGGPCRAGGKRQNDCGCQKRRDCDDFAAHQKALRWRMSVFERKLQTPPRGLSPWSDV